MFWLIVLTLVAPELALFIIAAKLVWLGVCILCQAMGCKGNHELSRYCRLCGRDMTLDPKKGNE